MDDTSITDFQDIHMWVSMDHLGDGFSQEFSKLSQSHRISIVLVQQVVGKQML